MRETEEKHGWAESELAGREELGRVHHEEDPSRTDDLVVLDYVTCEIDLSIPGYVMWDWNRGVSRRSKKRS